MTKINITDVEVSTRTWESALRLSDGTTVTVQRWWTGVPPHDCVRAGIEVDLPTGERFGVSSDSEDRLESLAVAMYEAVTRD